MTARLAVEEDGPPNGPRIVLAHGFTQTARSWADVGSALAADGWRVVRVDLPGHGGSGAVRADLVTGARLLGEAGGEGVYVGYSMGARHCLKLLVDQPARVRAAALLGATAGIEDDVARAARVRDDEALAETIERDGVDSFLDRWLALPLFAGLPDDPTARADRRRNTASGLAASLRLAGTGTQEPLWSRLGTIGAPVLAMAGEHDAKFVPIAERIARLVPAGQVALVPGAGHAAHLEQPESFCARLREWLTTLP
jgi:2-succinyl-6-hydroxy-2,4-cyclohexadiene-1-carboxylate synthase